MSLRIRSVAPTYVEQRRRGIKSMQEGVESPLSLTVGPTMLFRSWGAPSLASGDVSAPRLGLPCTHSVTFVHLTEQNQR